MLDSSAFKLLLMGGTAVAAIVVAIVVGFMTFSEPSESIPPLDGIWVRKQGVASSGPSQGGSPGPNPIGDILSFDAATAESGTVTLTTSVGSFEGKILKSSPFALRLEVQVKGDQAAHVIFMRHDDETFLLMGSPDSIVFERKP
jgi:hypothetical protein